jgi:hypothetical protein
MKLISAVSLLVSVYRMVSAISKLVPFIYVQLKLRPRAYNTAAAHLWTIQAFYTNATSRDLDIDDAILTCRLETFRSME